MPVGIQRINAKKSQPNSQIVFIKPLKGTDESIAQDFLERIAAQCLPIMREHHLSVMTLEEYEPNREFVGRNFNAGEVIQLVLKSPATGRWLPFHYVQMVMMHELAHCKQMNHSKAFWAVRNQYAEQMRTLWARSYTGEGLWGRGASLRTGEFELNTVTPDEVLTEHLCGGTYRSRRKRKAKDQPSYQERKERRILRKFGANGMALGDDEDVKAELEKGRRTQAKPRVAGSKRGRELRAAAALARFDGQKKEETDHAEDPGRSGDQTTGGDDSETASESDEEGADPDAVDIDGKRMIDGKGHRMIKVCEDEGPDGDDAHNELKELQLSMTRPGQGLGSKASTVTVASSFSPPRHSRGQQTKLQSSASKTTSGEEVGRSSVSTPAQPLTGMCPLCSFDNGTEPTTCAVCSHVLDRSKIPGTWRCENEICKESLYVNAGDVVVCGVCSKRKA